MKEETSFVEDTCTVYVQEDNVKNESTEFQGMKHSPSFSSQVVASSTDEKVKIASSLSSI